MLVKCPKCRRTDDYKAGLAADCRHCGTQLESPRERRAPQYIFTRMLLFGFGGLSILGGVLSLGTLGIEGAASAFVGGAMLFAVQAIVELLVAIRDRPAGS